MLLLMQMNNLLEEAGEPAVAGEYNSPVRLGGMMVFG
jgi:hypothetical protein